MSDKDIEPADVIRLIEQYLKENNLLKSLQTLQDETSVNLNTVDSIDNFVQDIISGHWDVVLKVVKMLKIPDNKLMDLYEQIAIELIELRETRSANWLIHKSAPMIKLKSVSPDRYMHLKNLLGRSFFDYKEAYREGSSKEKRRSAIAEALKKEVNVVPPQRLLTLIGDSMKWQRHEGLLPSESSIDVFTGKAHMVHAEEETYPNVLHKHCVKPINDADGSIFVFCAEFSPDGHYLVIGYSTGLIELRNSTTGRLAKDLKYQVQKNSIITPSKSAALALCFSTNDVLAVGDEAGDISVWKVSTGQLIQLFKTCHHKHGVSCLMFHKDGREILSGGHDTLIKLHGLRSNKTIREFRGHKSFVKSIAFSRDGNHIVSGGTDMTVKIWSAKSAQLLHEYKSSSKVHTVLLMPNFKSDIFLIADKSRTVHLIDLEAKVRAELLVKSREDEAADVHSACLSPKGCYIYPVDSKHIFCLNYSTKKVQHKLTVHDSTNNDIIGVKHHPFLNLLATFDTAGNLKLWKP